MTYDPDTVDSLYADLRDRVSGKIRKITNFTENSFNRVFFSAISRYFREVELRLLASELSAYVEYAGGPLTEDDLERLDISDVEPDEINPYLHDEHLENLVDVLGISRNEGDRATGFIDVETTTRSTVSIPEGTIVSTSPDSDGNTLEYRTVEDETSASGEGKLFDIEVEAVSRGQEYNIAADAITRFNDPPLGVRGIADSTGMSGGEDIESNDSLRERARNAVSEQPTGGTSDGVVGYISNNVENVDPENISITELYDENLVEVTVDGGGDTEVETAIDEGRPLGVQHDLIRPQTIEISIKAKLLGQDINISFVSNELENYLLSELNVGDNFYKDEVIKTIVNSSSNILNVSSISMEISGVTNERFEYDGSDKYRLDFSYDGDESTIFDEYENVYTESDGDYEIIDDTGETSDDNKDTINWLTGPSGDVSEGDDFFINYSSSQETNSIYDEEHTFNANQSDTIKKESESEYKLSEVPDPDTLVVEDPDGSTPYTEGTDYTIENTEGPLDETTFVFNSGQDLYELNESVFESSVIVEDEDGNQYTEGSDNDYIVIDDDGDDIEETIEWTDNGDTPSDGQNWTAEYRTNNGIAQTIVWQGETEPTVGDNFIVKYEQSIYVLDNEIDTINDEKISCDCSSSSYTYEEDFDFVDYNASGKEDSIHWLSGESRPSDGVQFYVTYKTEGDLDVTKQQKIDAGNIRLTEK